MANEIIEVGPEDVVLDTCVLVDLLIDERPRHALAKKLAEALASSNRNVFIPAHAYFEFVAAILCERRQLGAPPTLVGKRSALLPFSNVVVSIDDAFVTDYLAATMDKLMDVRGGADMIFVAIAARHGIRLISEDERMIAAAQKAGVRATNIATYMSDVG